MNQIKQAVVSHGSSALRHLPDEWNVKSDGGKFYKLVLRMYNLTTLENLVQERSSATSRVDDSQNSLRVLELDVSLNNLSTLDLQDTVHFAELRTLNASLNQIQWFSGIEKLRNLRWLDLSHNRIKQLTLSLAVCHELVSLNLSVNHIENLNDLPALNNLRVLSLDHNQLTAINGIQALPSLRELNVQHNKLKDIIPIAGCFHLTTLNAADNELVSLQAVTETLSSLRRLDILNLYNNPIAKDNKYQDSLVRGTSVHILDNVTVRRTSDHTSPRNNAAAEGEATRKRLHSTSVHRPVMELARQAFYQHLVEKRRETQEKIHYLQHQIALLQESEREYEERINCDMDACLMYLSTVSEKDTAMFTYDYFRDVLASPIPGENWKQTSSKYDAIPPPSGQVTSNHGVESTTHDSCPPPHTKRDYRNVRDTDEVLRHTYNELTAVRLSNDKDLK